MNDKAYSYEDLGVIKGQILAVCEQVARDNPTAWRQAHNGNFDETSTRYNDLCVQALRAVGIFAGCNGKRGGDQRSDDILNFGLTDGRGARDTSGRFPSIAIIDFINGAGGANPSVGWNDVSQSAPGKFLDPQGLARVDGGTTAPPPTTPTPPVTPPQPPKPDESEVRFRILEAKLDALIGNVEEMKAQAATRPTLGEIRQAMNELVLGSEVMGFLRPELDAIKNKPAGGGCVFRR